MKKNEIYLHLSNSGASILIKEESWTSEGSKELFTWPSVTLETTTFGSMTSSIKFETDSESLRVIGEMFIAASKNKFNLLKNHDGCTLSDATIEGEYKNHRVLRSRSELPDLGPKNETS